jgi:putative ABC transport system permease protein
MKFLGQDFQYAFRQLRKSPGFALTAILSLALGIGATTAVFSVMYGVLLNPYPYRDPERLVHLVLKDRAGREHWPGFSGPQLQRLEAARSVDNLSAEDEWNLTTTGDGLPEDVVAIYFSGSAFRHFGVPPLLGRELGPADAPFGQEPAPVVVLGYKFWQRHYRGDRQIVGHTVQLVHKTYTIVGILPPRFVWGDGDVYLPQKITSDPNRAFSVNIRLKPGITYAAANAELQAVLEGFPKQKANQFPEHFRVHLKGLNDQFVERLGKTLFLLLSAVTLLLLIGCANVSILLLARGTTREHELAVRAAIGASRSRILLQLLIESLCLSITGALFGVLLAYRTVALISAWLPEYSFPHEAAISINLPVLAFSVGLALLTSILFGLSPAISLSRPEIAQVIQANTRKATGGLKGKRTNNMLIAGQIALTLLLMTAAGAAIGGFLQLMHTGLGYDPHNTMSVGIPVHENSYMAWEQRANYFEQLRQRIETTPNVVSAGISTNATPPSNGWETNFEIFGKPASEQQQLRTNFVSPEYFAVLRIPLRQGRLLDRAETMRGARVAIVNETLARRYWPNGDAIGHRMRVPLMKGDPPYSPAAPGSDSWLEIVGVVADARDDGLRKPVRPAVYVPYTMVMRMFTQILVRTKVLPLSLLHNIRAQVLTVNPEQQVMGDVRSLEQWITREPEWAQQRLVASLFGAFAVLALVLAAVGLYSVVSYTVAQRTNEIGIRMSLGARQNHVLQLIFTSTAASVGAGLAVGLVLSFALNEVFQQWAEGSSRDPSILLGVTALLILSSAAACFFPARRASSVDPMIALRYQ